MNKFTITTNKSLKLVFIDLRKQIEIDHGGSLSGDIKSGQFSVRGITGTYSTLNKNAIEFNITEKPFFISMAWVQSELQKYFN